MATYLWSDAITHVSRYVKGVPTSSLDAIACDNVNALIYRFWFWKWTMGNLTTITAVDGTQDYTIADADFYRLYRCRLTRTDITPNAVREIVVLNFLSPNVEQKGSVDTILGASYNYEINKLRLDKAASVPSGVLWNISGDYQKTPAKITSIGTTIIFPDYYFDVAIEGLKWKYYDLIGDSRAGSMQLDKKTGARQFTGQLGTFKDAMMAMAEAEGMGQGDSQRFPDDGFGVGRSTNPGLFAWS